jgi:hypothetical protein
MKNKILSYLFISTTFVCLAFLPIGCSKDNLEDNLNCSDFGTLSYKSNIAPLIIANCATSACHTTGFSAGDFTSHTGVLTKVNNGSMRKRTLDGTMPPNSKISDDQIRMIVCWIDNGALNN